jgi:hypothetical protein
MKKFLLSIAACSAMSAFAWDNPYLSTLFPVAGDIDGADATPAGLKFNTYNGDFIGFHPTDHGSANWNCANHIVNESKKEGVDFTNGYAFIGGPNFNANAANTEEFNKSCKIIDLGGTCGKVLAITFKGSEFNSVAKEITGVDYGLVDYSTVAFPLFYWVPNPDVMKSYAKGGDTKTLRVRIEANIYSKEPGASEIFKAYVNDDENNVQPNGDNAASDILMTEAEFAKRWCDTDEAQKDDDMAQEPSVWDDGTPVWYPNRWLVYEFDFGMAQGSDDGDWNYAPKIKMEVPGGGSYTDFAILIRNIQFYEPTGGCDIVTATRKRTYNNYTLGAPSTGGVSDVAVENGAALEVSVNGGIASFSENAVVYNFAGARVGAGRNVALAKGVYVANANGKAVKFVVR